MILCMIGKVYHADKIQRNSVAYKRNLKIDKNLDNSDFMIILPIKQID